MRMQLGDDGGAASDQIADDALTRDRQRASATIMAKHLRTTARFANPRSRATFGARDRP